MATYSIPFWVLSQQHNDRERPTETELYQES